MNRREGYYWCKLDGKWDIFIWWAECEVWYDGMQNRYEETDFEEIDERRITREVQKTSIEKFVS